MSATYPVNLDSLYELGDVYDALDAVNELETKVARLQRLHLIDEAEWMRTKQDISRIRERLRQRLAA